jgi:hypothetical protein
LFSKADHAHYNEQDTDHNCSITPVENQWTTFGKVNGFSDEICTGLGVQNEFEAITLNRIVPTEHMCISSKLMLLTSDKCKNLRFPVNTPIWWEETDACGGSFNEGIIKAAYFDVSYQDLL